MITGISIISQAVVLSIFGDLKSKALKILPERFAHGGVSLQFGLQLSAPAVLYPLVIVALDDIA